MRSVRWLGALAVCLGVAVAAGCGSAPGAAPVSPDRLAQVTWDSYVQDCSVEHGGPGLGPEITDVVKGDATRDGQVDTFVVNECRSSTSPWPEVVDVFDGASDPSAPRRIATLLAGDEHYLRDLKVSVAPDGMVMVSGLGLSASAPNCCPDLAVRDMFRFDGTRFVQTDHAETPMPAPS